MPSKMAALVRNFLGTDAEALCLVPGERLYLMRGLSKTVVGREILSEDSFRAVAGELAPGHPTEKLADRRARFPFRLYGEFEKVEVEFGRLEDRRLCMTVTRAPGVPTPSQPAVPSVAATTTSEPAIAAPPASPPRKAEAPTHPLSSEPLRTAPTPALLEASGRKSSTVHGGVPRHPIDVFLHRMLEAEASDLHLSSGAVPIFRINGEIVPQTDLPELSSADVEKLLGPILPERYRKEFEERSDADFAYEIERVSRFRVNLFRDRRGAGAVFRQIPLGIRSVKDLNLPPAVVDLAALSRGLVLVTGPTGCGKSTTLAAIIDHINDTRTDHIITIEDPIEFIHPNKRCLVNQREVGNHTRGFKDALRAALREDPDIVLVGEMRDLETVAIAIETAETGHLVFGTLHTTTATSTVDRLIDQFPEDRQAQVRVMLADSLRGVVAQTLVRQVGGGRTAAFEILLSNNAVANLIRDAKSFQLPSIMQTSKAQGMVMLNDSLLDLVKRGLVDPQEAYVKATDKPGLLSAFNNSNIPCPAAGKAVEAPAPKPPSPFHALAASHR